MLCCMFKSCCCQKDSALLLALLAALPCNCLLAPLQGVDVKEVQPQGCLEASKPAYLKRRNVLDSRPAHLQLCDCGFSIHTRPAQLVDQLLATQQQLDKVLVVCRQGTRSLLARLSSSCLWRIAGRRTRVWLSSAETGTQRSSAPPQATT